jgi:hypothetical protein
MSLTVENPLEDLGLRWANHRRKASKLLGWRRIGAGFLYRLQGDFSVACNPMRLRLAALSLAKSLGVFSPEIPVRPTLEVFFGASLHDLAGFGQRCEPTGIRTSCPDRSVERCQKSIVRWLARTRECDPQVVQIALPRANSIRLPLAVP